MSPPSTVSKRFGATKCARLQAKGAPCAPAARAAVCACTAGKGISARSVMGAASALTVRKNQGVSLARAVDGSLKMEDRTLNMES